MPKLIVRPLDLTKPGSLKLRNQLFDALACEEEASESKRWRDWKVAISKSQDLILPHLYMDDGSDVKEALEQLSVEQFKSLYVSFIGGSEDGAGEGNASS